MRSLRVPVASLWVLCCPPILIGQQYVDERVAFGFDATTASQTELLHGDVDGDGRDELVVRNLTNVDWVLRNSPKGFEYVDLVDGNDSSDSFLVDLNGDGRRDLLTQDFVNLGYYRGQFDGTLGSFAIIQAEGPQESFWIKRAADVNGDGKVDVVCSLATDSFGQSGVLRWYAGNGAGTFSMPQSTASTPYPVRFELGDFNADGFVDAAATGPQGQGAFVFQGTGNGFAPPQPVAASGAEARLLAVGDFDADGIDDLVCYPAAASFTWFRGGVGGLVLGGTHTLPGATVASRDIEAADLDLDGADDLLLVESFSDNGRVWRSFGAAGSGLAAPSVVLDIPCAAVTAFEYDGLPGLDLAFTELSSVWPTLRPGDGNGGFLQPVDLVTPGACTDADSVCAGDLDRDGALDLAFESGVWLRGVGDGSFHPAVALGARPSQLVDFNGDGRLDAVGLLPACGPASGLTVSLQLAAGFGPAFQVPQPPAGVQAFTLADLDLDGDVDLATAGTAGTLSHMNDGAGGFAPSVATGLPASTQIGAGDLNGDALPDLAVTTVVLDPFVAGVKEAKLHWGLSIGGGMVGALQSKNLFMTLPGPILIEDLNADGLADVVFSQSSVLGAWGDGAGNLGSLVSLISASGILDQSIAAADMDGDGEPNLIAGGGPAGRVAIGRRGPFGYEVWRDFRAGAGAGKLLPYDFDADGQIDLAWGQGGTVRLALNRRPDPAGTSPFGNGTFGCLGRATLGTIQPAKAGNQAFRLLAGHLPPNSLGWFLLGTGASIPGTDPFGVGVLLHVDPLPPAFFTLVPSLADAAGQAELAVPIPPGAIWTGATFTVQVVHTGVQSPGMDCSMSPLALVSSRGLSLTIQP